MCDLWPKNPGSKRVKRIMSERGGSSKVDLKGTYP